MWSSAILARKVLQKMRDAKTGLEESFINGVSLSRAAPISFLYEFHRPPYGGGNQFLLGLRKEFHRRHTRVLSNRGTLFTRSVLFNSYNFQFRDLDAFDRKKVRFVHRVDGPIGVYRGEGIEIDRRIFEINSKYADRTVFQSEYSLAKHLELGLQLKNPIVIPNAVDPEVFYPGPRLPSKDPAQKIKIVASSWSDNPRKGGPLYQWLDEHLDQDQFEFTFVGRTKSPLKFGKQLGPLASSELAEVLRAHDLYITASEDDPCSNALIEAMACGCAVVFRNSGGHPELVGKAGVAFHDESDVLDAIRQVAQHLEQFQSQLAPPSYSEVASRYLQVLLE